MPATAPIPALTPPTNWSIALFCGLMAAVLCAVILGIARRTDETEISHRRWRINAWGMGFLWTLTATIIPGMVFLVSASGPAPALLFAASCFVLLSWAAVTETGGRLSRLPIAALVGFHAFRLPLELILHHWYEVGTLPIQMTYEGRNFDIITGVLAVLIGAWGAFSQPPKAIIWLFNLVGFGLLLTVVSIAVLSAPTPFRQFSNDPPVLLIFYLPYSWIVSIAVSGAFLGHLVLFRRLLRRVPKQQT